MKIYRRMGAWLVVCLLFGIGAPGTYAASHPPLWQKAVQIAAMNRAWLPGMIDQQMEEVKKKGETEVVEEVHVYLSLDEDGNVIQEVKMMKDGQEEDYVPEESDSDDDETRDFSNGMVEDFLNPDFQDAVRVTTTEQHKTIAGQSCIAYDFRFEGEEEVMTGTAWLDGQSGMPIEVQYIPDPLPEHVKEMSQTVRYHTASPTEWYPEEISIHVSGGFLIFKKQYRITVNLKDYWKHPNIDSITQ